MLYTRTTDVYQRPIDKARIANESGGDYFVSFHRNSSPMRNTYSGVQTLVYDDSGIKSELAGNINSELNKVGFADLGIPERKNLVVLRRTQMPAVLIETGFINTDADNELYDTRFDDIAGAITRAIVNTVGDNTSEVANTLGDNTSELVNTDIEKETNLSNAPDRKVFGVQVGLFRRYENARYLYNQLAAQGYYVQLIDKPPFYAVVVGRERNVDEAVELENSLKWDGYDTLIVTL